jgi:hypothetical protein
VGLGVSEEAPPFIFVFVEDTVAEYERYNGVPG